MPKKILAFDIIPLIVPIILIVLGVAVIYSLLIGGANSGLIYKQIALAFIGIGIMIFASFSDYRFFKGTSWIFYGISLLLLMIVLFVGKTTNGATNWLDLKVFQLQPSEIAKIFLITSLSVYFSERIGKMRWLDIIFSAVIFIIPLGLVLMEPDLGTALVMCFIYIVLLLLTKLDRKKIAVIFLSIAILLTTFGLAIFNVKPFSKLLHDYQRSRIMVFINPKLDPLGRGYNVRQAQITIGSGGAFGKGLGRGTQSQLQFLPEAHTDFIFAGIAESFGFVGVFIVVALYGLFLMKILDIANISRDNFGMLVTFGIASMFFFQVLINIGMNIGLAPVTGIPLPFLSYGGTSLIVSLFAAGLVESVFIRHKKITF